MRSVSSTSEAGNALVEFIGFAVLAIAPISIFATSTSIQWVEKAQLQSTAALLARAYYLGGVEGFDLQRELSAKPGWQIEVQKDEGVVLVTLTSGELEASARGIL